MLKLLAGDVNAHWCSPLPNATVPIDGSSWMSPILSSMYIETMTFTFSTTLRNLEHEHFTNEEALRGKLLPGFAFP